MEKIRRQLYLDKPWLSSKEQDFVFHNDIDGLLTALFCCHFLKWKPVGIYDLHKLWIDKNYAKPLSTPIYVDLDITYHKIKSIGHHILFETNKNSINVNNVFKVGLNNYARKYPLGTILFLMWLFKTPMPNNKYAQLMLLHADTVWKSFGTYKKNVSTWLKKMNFTYLLQVLETTDIEDIMTTYIYPKTYGGNKQCNFTVKNGKIVFLENGQSILPFITYLEKIFQWGDLSSSLSKLDMNLGYTFDRQKIEKEKNTSPVLDYTECRKTGKIFSHSIKFYNTVDISVFHP